MNVLVLNSGSSSLKFQLIATDLGRIAQNGDERLCRGLIEQIGGEAIVAVVPKSAQSASTGTYSAMAAPEAKRLSKSAPVRTASLGGFARFRETY